METNPKRNNWRVLTPGQEKFCSELWFEIKGNPEKVRRFVESIKNVKKEAEELNMNFRLWAYIRKNEYGIGDNISRSENMKRVYQDRYYKHDRKYRLPTPEEYHKRFGSETTAHDVG